MWDKVSSGSSARQVRGVIPIEHSYTAGVAGERFFLEMKNHCRLTASRCPKCQRIFAPPKLYCEICFEEAQQGVPVEGQAWVKTFTILHRSLEGPLASPVVVALVGWDGVEGGIIHRLGEVKPEEVYIGMPVNPQWKAERIGSILDIAFFRPA